ncbi:MAG: Pycsar system effector family protein [Methylococcales bacterium]
MNDSDKLKTFTAMAETTRKWVSVMDTKAGFLSALNAGLLGFIWTGAKLADGSCWSKGLAILATVFSLASLLVALWVVLPRASLKKIFGRNMSYVEGFKPISFYGFVADHYPKGEDGRFLEEVKKLDEDALIDEALEQHFTLSHIVQTKSNYVVIAGRFLMVGLLLAGAALFSKVLF